MPRERHALLYCGHTRAASDSDGVQPWTNILRSYLYGLLQERLKAFIGAFYGSQICVRRVYSDFISTTTTML